MVASSNPSKQASHPVTRRGGSRGCTVSIWVLIISTILAFQLAYFNRRDLYPPQVLSTDSLLYALDYPRGTAVALPSVLVSAEEDKQINREIYGGKGDAKHLGGFTEIDMQGISPAVWKYMVTYFGVKSLLDVGCGRGISTSWFVLHGVDALCVEGSHDAVLNSILPDPSKQIVEHDFSRGPWWPSHTVDAVWCVEFLEHVGRNFHHNYLPAFRKAALIFASSSLWGGWHHVEVHDDIWWISKFQSYGFVYSPELTKMVRDVAYQEVGNITVTGEKANPQHIWLTMKVYINPAVAALPEHAHLFAEHGCFDPYTKVDGKQVVNKECTGDKESVMPKSFYPINMTDAMDQAWENLVKKNIKKPEKTE